MSVIMKSAALCIAALFLVTVATTAQGRPRAYERHLSTEYSGPGMGVDTPRLTYNHDACEDDDPPPGCVRIKIGPRDRFVDILLDDAVSGPLISAVVTVENAKGHFDFVGRACGDSMEVALAIPPGYDYLEVQVLAGACYGTTTPSVPTTGLVELHFTDRLFS